MRAYAEEYLNDVVENQGKLFDFIAQTYPDKDTEEFINTYMASKTRKSIDEAQAYVNTMDAKGEVLLTIMASLAQQESQSLSQNVKLGLQYRYQNGQMSINHNRFLGFTKDEDGHLIVEPTEAEVVK